MEAKFTKFARSPTCEIARIGSDWALPSATVRYRSASPRYALTSLRFI